jgi:GGDEF domain-containing protein
MFVDEAVFNVVAHLELQKSVRLQYPVCFVTILLTPDRPVSNPDRLAETVGHDIRSLLRDTDLVSRSTSPMTLCLLLVDADLEQLPAVARRIREEIGHTRFPLDDQAVAVRLQIGAASFPTSATTLEQLVTQARQRAEAEV